MQFSNFERSTLCIQNHLKSSWLFFADRRRHSTHQLVAPSYAWDLRIGARWGSSRSESPSKWTEINDEDCIFCVQSISEVFVTVFCQPSRSKMAILYCKILIWWHFLIVTICSGLNRVTMTEKDCTVINYYLFPQRNCRPLRSCTSCPRCAPRSPRPNGRSSSGKKIPHPLPPYLPKKSSRRKRCCNGRYFATLVKFQTSLRGPFE